MKDNEMKNVISKVLPNSIAEELEIEVGDILLSVNGKNVVDVLDFLYLMSDDYLEVEIEKKDGEVWVLEIEKDYDEDLGIEFDNPILDSAKSCRNKCVFCFIDQMPEGMRPSLYFKDDDSRLSFLQGNFVTLTNISDEDIDRIIEYNISPINVSIHTTNPELRKEMLCNKFAGNILERVKRLTEHRIVVNGQIVLCPGYNDGEELDRTLSDLSELGENLNSIAIVPIGLTKYREGLADMSSVSKTLAGQTIEQVKRWQQKFLSERETRFVFLSDEFYILAEQELPSYDFYEGFTQLENGVGLITKLKTEIEQELSRVTQHEVVPKEISIVTGKAASHFIESMAKLIMETLEGIEIRVHSIENNFFGTKVTVAGLVTAVDIADQLDGKALGSAVIIPKSMLKSDEDIFLDDISLSELEDKLGVSIKPVENNGEDFLSKIIR